MDSFENKVVKVAKVNLRKLITFVRLIPASKVMERSSCELSKLDFFDSFFYGTGIRQISRKHSIHADASVTFVIKRKGAICGVVSGDLTSKELVVKQLQGVRRAKFHDGADFGTYMLQCAEEIAKALGLERISVRAFSYPKEVPLNRKQWAICGRKFRIYNQVPQLMGYKYIYSAVPRFRRRVLNLSYQNVPSSGLATS